MSYKEKIPRKVWQQIKITEDRLLDAGVSITANKVFKQIKIDFAASERNRDAYRYLFSSAYSEIPNYHRHLLSGVIDRGDPLILTDDEEDVLPEALDDELAEVKTDFDANQRKLFAYSIESYIRKNAKQFPKCYDYFVNCSIEESLYRSAVLSKSTNEAEFIEKDRDYEDFSR